jgi:hypothetical protein
LVSENVFLPVAPQLVVSISEIVSVPAIVCIPNIVRVPQIVSIPELSSGVSLVPNRWDSWVSAIREWRDTVALRDSCYRVRTGTSERTSIRIERPPVRGRW